MLWEHLPRNFINHLALFNVLLSVSTCSDVFVLLSGYVCGLTFGRTLLQKGVGACYRRVTKRSLQIYTWNLATFFLIFGLIRITSWTSPLAASSAHLPLWRGLLPVRLPEYFDILPTYMVWLMALPLMLLGLRRNPATVLRTSFLVYLGVQCWHVAVGRQTPVLWLGWVDPLAWQFLFCCGACLGFRKLQGQSLPNSFSPNVLRMGSVILAIGVTYRIILRLIHYDAFGIVERFAPSRNFLTLTDKYSLAPFRLIWFAALVMMAFRYRHLLRLNWGSRFARLIICCGQNSLSLYCVHTALVYVADFVRIKSNSLAMQLVVAVLSTAILIGAGWFMSFRKVWMERLKVRGGARVRLVY